MTGVLELDLTCLQKFFSVDLRVKGRIYNALVLPGSDAAQAFNLLGRACSAGGLPADDLGSYAQ